LSAAIEPQTLPHSEESERAVLAAVLIDAEKHLPQTASRLRSEDFYFERHQKLYQSMLELQSAGMEIDLRTVQARLEQQKSLDAIGGLAYLATLDVDLPDLSRVESYVEIIKERSLRRRLLDACTDIYRTCMDGGLEARYALDRAEQRILELGEEAISKGFVPLRSLLDDTLREIEVRGESEFPGLRTGFGDLDRMSHGLNPGNLIILAGRPGMGKTSLALNIAEHVAIRERKGVGVFSLEMSEHEIVMRILSSESGIPYGRLRQGRLSDRDWTKLIDVRQRLSDAPIWLDESANPSLLEVASKTRRLRGEKKLDLLVIDYLQLMQSGVAFESRNLEIGAITRGLKQLAKELGIPVIALSQLSRQPERRGSDHRPQLADLRESGSIEQDADLVAFIYRDEVYNADDPENQGAAELIVAKNRHGETGVIDLHFDGEITRFLGIDRHAAPPPDLER
jgi:replicative DNA helicase